MRNMVDTAYSNIDILLRNLFICPQSCEHCQGYMTHEPNFLKKLAGLISV